MIDSQEALHKLLDISEKIPFFNTLTKAEIADLVTDVKILTYHNKQIIFREGEESREYMFYLLHGKISISKKSLESGVNVRIATIEEPSLFGEMMRLTGEPRNATVEAVQENTLVLAFKVKQMKETTSISKFYKNVIQELVDKINHMNQRIH